MKKHAKYLAVLVSIGLFMSSLPAMAEEVGNITATDALEIAYGLEDEISAEGTTNVTITFDEPTRNFQETAKNKSLDPTVTPDDATVSYTTANNKVVTVSNNGKVSAVGYGTTTVRATATKDGKTATADVTINVYCTDFSFVENGQQVTSIRIPNGKDYTVGLKCPENFDGKALLSKITWDSMDTNIFTVANGVITPKKAGSTNLYAVLEAANNTGGARISKNVTVTVFNNVKSIQTDKDAYEAYPGESVQISASALPEDAEDKTLLYSTDNAEFAVDATGKVTLSNKASGTANITITANDGAGAKKVVKVSAIKAIEKISTTPERVVAIPGDVIEFKTDILPTDVKEKDVTITSDSEDVTVTGNKIKVSDKIKKDTLATITIKAKSHSEATATILVDVKTDLTGVVKEVPAGSSVEYEFKASSLVTKVEQLTARSLDETAAKIEKVEKTGDSLYKITITGVKEGSGTGIVVTATPDKDTSFFHYFYVKVTAPEVKPEPEKVTEVTVDNVIFKLEGEIDVLTDGKKAKGNYKVPAKVKFGEKEYPVKKIGNAAFKGSKITKLTTPSGLTEIGNQACMNCKSLTSVTIGKDVTKIGSKAFYNSAKLKNVTIKGKKLKKVGAKAFKKNKKGQTFKVPAAKKKAYDKLLKSKADKGYKLK